MMEWMWNAFSARIGWALGELAIVLAVIAIVIAVAAVRHVHTLWQQSRCDHARLKSAGVADTEQRCAKCDKFVCYTWDLTKYLAAKQETSS